MRSRFQTLLLAGCLAGVTGCASSPRKQTVVIQPTAYYQTAGISGPTPVPAVIAQCAPPLGWAMQPLKSSDRHTHQVWLSPTEHTAYGVIHFKLPLPVGINLVHWEFLREMKKREGEAVELSQKEDPTLPGLRFVCEGGHYKMRVNLVVDGVDGWAAYAGTRREFDEVPEELKVAEEARENTIFGLDRQMESAKVD